MNNFNKSKPTRLSKVCRVPKPTSWTFNDLCLGQVYFTWVIRDYGSAEWFHSLLHAIEEQDTQSRIEINIYFTGKIKEDDINNIIVGTFFSFVASLLKCFVFNNLNKVQDVGAEKDALTSLRAPTHYGRPNWDRVFTSIVEKHRETDVGVVSALSCLSLV